jgi:hypothetical protein
MCSTGETVNHTASCSRSGKRHERVKHEPFCLERKKERIGAVRAVRAAWQGTVGWRGGKGWGCWWEEMGEASHHPLNLARPGVLVEREGVGGAQPTLEVGPAQ